MSIQLSLRASTFGLSLLFAIAIPAGFAVAAGSPTVLAKVNGKEITDEDLKLVAEDIGTNLPPQLQGKARDAYLLDVLINAQLVAQKGIAEKLDQDPEFPKKLAYFRDKILMAAVLGKIGKDAATDDAMHKAYDDAAKAQKPEIEIHARHILLPTEEEAQAALKRVKAGEDFSKVAKELSKDPSSDGDDLGWLTRDGVVPEFADAAFKLEPGQVSDPVKSRFGWHVIKVEEKRQAPFPPFDEVKDQVARFVVQKAQSDFVVNLRKEAKIERTTSADETPAPQTPPAPEEKK